jgi:hypothetical protein
MTPGTPPERNMPYPEIVEVEAHDAPYHIIDTRSLAGLPSDGMTDKVGRRLLVPLHRSGRPVSRHELAHVKWSPDRLPKVRYDTRILLAIEDARINMGLESLGIPLVLNRGYRAKVGSLAAQDLEKAEVLNFVLRAIASLGTGVESELLEIARSDSCEIAALSADLIDYVRTRLLRGRESEGAAVASFETVKRLGREVARRLAAMGLSVDGSSAPLLVSSVGCCLSGELIDGEGLPHDHDGSVDGKIRRRAHSRDPRTAGRMTIRVAPLGIDCGRGRRGLERRWRPATEGSVVRWMHRHPIDGAIFRRPARSGGGSVLVDVSGSMSLKAEGVDQLLESAPTTTLVAIYSGSGGEGELRIVARGGKRADTGDLEPFGKGNIVDLPALEWLARQTPPRIWISDGGVTGIGDRRSPSLKARCASVRRRAAIRRVDTVAEAVRVLERR